MWQHHFGRLPTELLARYGKPTSICIGEEGAVRWYHDVSSLHAGSWLALRLYDGRVISVQHP